MFDRHFYHIFHTGTEIKSWIVPIKESSFKSFVSHSPCKTMIYTAPNRNMRFPSHEAPTFPDFSALLAPYCHSLHKQRDQNSGLPTSPSLPSTLRRDKTWDIFGSWPTWVFPFSTAVILCLSAYHCCNVPDTRVNSLYSLLCMATEKTASHTHMCSLPADTTVVILASAFHSQLKLYGLWQ